MTEHDRYDDEPELAGYVPHDDRPLRGPGMMRAMRIVVFIGLVALILPGIVITVSTSTRTAERACQILASASTSAIGSSARFELGGPAGPGWYCYELGFGGAETMLQSLGLIPELKLVPRAPATQDS